MTFVKLAVRTALPRHRCAPREHFVKTAQDYSEQVDEFLARWEKKYRPRVVATILSCGVRKNDAEDVAQDVWLRERCRLENGGPPRRSPASWLKTMAKHAAMDYHRNKAADARRRKRLANSGMVRTHFDPAAECESGNIEQMIQAMMAVVESLPQPEQQLLRWRFFKGYTLGAIAAELGISPPAVQKRLIKIYQRLYLELQRAC
jgi:RNA polymerase sigma factor (sigma-70 family)